MISFDSTVLVSSWSVRCIHPYYIIAFKSITFIYIQHWDVFLLQRGDSGACSRVLSVVLAEHRHMLHLFFKIKAAVCLYSGYVYWLAFFVCVMGSRVSRDDSGAILIDVTGDGEPGIFFGLLSAVAAQGVCTGLRRWLCLRSHPCSVSKQQS